VTGADAPGPDRYLDARYRLLTPVRLPDPEEVASGCYAASSAAIAELEEGGAIVDPTYEETVVRNLQCRWAVDEPRIAECRFERASISGFLSSGGADDRREDQMARLRERDWSKASARFALVAPSAPVGAGPRSPGEWIATDTCQPFVFRGEGWEIDPRDMIRNQAPPDRGRGAVDPQ
jgi:hypothetical protein